jgi:hypothetical protein
MHQCIRFHLSESQSVVKVFKVEPTFTIGYVSHRQYYFNKLSVEDIEAYLIEKDRGPICLA